MQQLDLFDETLNKKIHRMEKWILRLQRDVWFLKSVYEMRQRSLGITQMNPSIKQTDMFGS